MSNVDANDPLRDGAVEVYPRSEFIGESVVHRRYIAMADAHYGGGLVDGSYVLGLFADAATEMCIRVDGDEGLFASYDNVQFLAPVLVGDVIEAEAVLVNVGRRSRRIKFDARVVCRADPSLGESSSRMLSEPFVVATAEGTVVVPGVDSGQKQVQGRVSK